MGSEEEGQSSRLKPLMGLFWAVFVILALMAAALILLRGAGRSDEPTRYWLELALFLGLGTCLGSAYDYLTERPWRRHVRAWELTKGWGTLLLPAGLAVVIGLFLGWTFRALVGLVVGFLASDHLFNSRTNTFLPNLWKVPAWWIRRRIRKGNHAAAIALARSYSRIRPTDLAAWWLLADTLKRVDRHDEVTEVLTTGTRLLPANQWAAQHLYNWLFSQWESDGNPALLEEACRVAAQMRLVHPDSPAPYMNLFECAFQQGDWRKARYMASEANQRLVVDFDPAEETAHFVKLLVLVPGGQPMALEVLKRLFRTRTLHLTLVGWDRRELAKLRVIFAFLARPTDRFLTARQLARAEREWPRDGETDFDSWRDQVKELVETYASSDF